MSRYPAYPEYKDSGVAWLGEIPAHWDTKRLKFTSTVQPSNVDKKSNDGEEPVLLCNYTDVYNNEVIDSSIDFMRATATKKEIKKFLISQDDVIVTKDSESPDDIAVPTYVAEDFHNVLCGYHLTHIKPIGISGKFLFRLFQSKQFNAQFVVGANGVTRFGLPQRVINDAFVARPPLDEQRTIARFLDAKTAQIDALIAKKAALLAALAEQRTALISHAVTRGLDPAALMKDSGVAWLGEIPARWAKLKLRFLLAERLTNGLFKKKDSWGSGNRIVNVFDVYTKKDIIDEGSLDRVECTAQEANQYSAQHGDFFFVRSSLKLEGIGKSAVVLNPREPLVFECHLVRGRPNLDRVHPKFLNYYLNSHLSRELLVSKANQVTMTTIDQNKFKDLPVVLPSFDEQLAIVEYLDEAISGMENIERGIEDVIFRLKEYRTALITNAVTGKIDVRGVAVR